MDLLLRLLERRTLILIGCVLGAAWLVGHYGDDWLQRADMMSHPPAAASSPLAADILKDVEVREAARVRGVYRGVSAEIATARANGFQVDGMQKLADDIIAMDRAEYREAEIERLNKLRMAIPQKKPFTRTASAEDQNPDLLVAPTPKSKSSPRKAKRRR